MEFPLFKVTFGGRKQNKKNLGELFGDCLVRRLFLRYCRSGHFILPLLRLDSKQADVVEVDSEEEKDGRPNNETRKG
jgi:hypothetical protein